MGARLVVGVMATRNRRELIAERSLPSLLAQDHALDGLVVVDDSDPEQQAANAVALDRVRDAGIDVVYLVNEIQRGAAASWNRALVTAREVFGGCWVAMLDDDDVWRPDHVSSCLTAAALAGATGVIAGIEVVLPDRRIRQPLLDTLRVNDFLRGNPGWQGSNTFVLVDRLLEVGGFAEEMPSTLDRDLAVRVLLRGVVQWAFTGRHTVEYHIDPARDVLSRRGSSTKLEGLVRFHERYGMLMDDEDHRQFCNRAQELFGAAPLLFPRRPNPAVARRLDCARAVLTGLTSEPLELLGAGKEGVVVTDGQSVFKVFDGWQDPTRAEKSDEIVDRIARVLAHRPAPDWLPRDGKLHRIEAGVVWSYAYEPSEPFLQGHAEQVIALFNDLRGLGLMNYGYRPSSFRVVAGTIWLVDLGCDLMPWDEQRIKHNLERAYLMIEYGDRPDLKSLQEDARLGRVVPELRSVEQFMRRCGWEVSTR